MTYIIGFPDKFSIFHLYYCISTTGDWSTCCNPHDLSWHYSLSWLEIETHKKEMIYFAPAKETLEDVTVFETDYKRKIPLEKEMATHCSILTWRIPWTEKPGGLQSTRSWRVGHDWTTNTFFFFFHFHERRVLFILGKYSKSQTGTLTPKRLSLDLRWWLADVFPGALLSFWRAAIYSCHYCLSLSANFLNICKVIGQSLKNAMQYDFYEWQLWKTSMLIICRSSDVWEI